MLLRGLACALLLVPAQEPDPRMLRLLDVVERRHRTGVDPGDVRAAAARLGFDRGRIAAHVRDAIAWEPYEGVLRDASGTLRAGSGNALDRALLLQAMLEAGGHRARLVRGDLDEASGRALLGVVRPRPAAAVPADLAGLAADLGVDAEALGRAVEPRRRDAEALVTEVLEASAAESERLAVLLGARERRPSAPPTKHYWVQVAEKGAWADLDPSPMALRAAAPVPVSAADLAGLRRRISFRLSLVRRSGEKRETVPLLSLSFDPAVLLCRPVELVVLPDAREALSADSLRALGPRARIERLRTVKVWRAGMVVDGRRYGAAPFDLKGTVYEVDRGGAAGAARGLGRGVGGALGGFGAALGGEKPGEGPAGVLERLDLDVVLREPDGSERAHRRALLGPSVDGLSPLPLVRYAFMIDGAPLPPGEAARRELAALARMAPLVRSLQRGGKAASPAAEADVPSLLLRFAELRRRAFERMADGRPWGQDRPGLSAETLQVFVEDSSGAGRVRRAIDIFENPLNAEPDLARRAGVADTVLEAALVARARPGEVGRSAWPRLERGRLGGGRAEILEKDGRIRIRWSEDAWWDVDPATGGCVGRTASGAGQGMVEYAWEQASNACNYADLVGVVGAGPVGQAAQDAADLYGNVCGLVGGTWARDQAMSRIKDMNQNFWNASLAALSGL